ncbi:MAG: HIT family protein [Candidatus Woesearchaeota archaeon]
MACKWCTFDDQHLIIKEYKYWRLSIAESQILLGWTHASLRRHVCFFDELEDKELAELKAVVKEIRHALAKTFKPDWFNVMQLGNMTPHLHFQLVPRYRTKRTFAGREFVDSTFGRPIADKWVVEDDKFLVMIRDHLKDAMQS